MTKHETKRKTKIQNNRKYNFNPYRLISDEEFRSNMTAIIVYYEISKGEANRRFTSPEPWRKDLLAS